LYSGHRTQRQTIFMCWGHQGLHVRALPGAEGTFLRRRSSGARARCLLRGIANINSESDRKL
jgi:hypothetical protein